MTMRDRLAALRDVATVVREPLRLGARRLRGRSTIGRYHLRGSGLAVHLRHDVVDDLATLVQTFRQDHFVPPPPAERVLLALGRPIRAVDLGGNIGMFGAWLLLRHPDAEVTAYEADPANARIHALTVEANRPRARWELFAAAAGVADGEARFVTGRGAHSRLARADDADAATVPMVDVLARAAGADLLKVDIEGAEWSLLGDPRFRGLQARVVALEYHAERCPGDDPLAAATSALEDAGYEVTPAELVAPPGHGMVWGWRKE
jgi:FkbM family methyltransferase